MFPINDYKLVSLDNADIFEWPKNRGVILEPPWRQLQTGIVNAKLWFLVSGPSMGWNQIITYIYNHIYIYTLSFQTLQICRVQTKTLGLAVIMLKTLGLSQKTGFSYKLSEFDIVLASNTSPTLLHHMFLRFSSIQPYRQETTSTLYIWSREKRNPNMEKYGSGIQASSKPCSTRDLPVSTRVFLRNTQGL